MSRAAAPHSFSFTHTCLISVHTRSIAAGCASSGGHSSPNCHIHGLQQYSSGAGCSHGGSRSRITCCNSFGNVTHNYSTSASYQLHLAQAQSSTRALQALPSRFRIQPQRLTVIQRAAALAAEAVADSEQVLQRASGYGRTAPPSFSSPASDASQYGGQRGRISSPGARASHVPTSAAASAVPPIADSASGQPLEVAHKRFVGVLQSVPTVSPSKEHLASALKRASRLAYASGIRNEAEKERNKAARQLDLLMKELSVPLTRYVNGFPDPSKLHPFEQALLQLTVGVPLYKSVLSKVDNMRKTLLEVGKAFASQAASAPTKLIARQTAADGFVSLERVYRTGAKYVDDLKSVAKALRGLPQVNFDVPTLALVGAPNVGKSSLVKLLSSGLPEVQNYPFTTRSIKMGHFYLDGRKHQVTDTPGLLARPDAERNAMEQLTLAALSCLPTSVLFVFDLTEECGTSVRDQWAIRQELRERFPTKPWMDVFSKADMLQDVFEGAAAAVAGHNKDTGSGSRSSSDVGADGGARAVIFNDADNQVVDSSSGSGSSSNHDGDQGLQVLPSSSESHDEGSLQAPTSSSGFSSESGVSAAPSSNFLPRSDASDGASQDSSTSNHLNHRPSAWADIGDNKLSSGDANGNSLDSSSSASGWTWAKGGAPLADNVVISAEHLALRLPQAARVSSLTEEGMPNLQAGIVAMLQRSAAAAASAAAAEAAAVGAAEALSPAEQRGVSRPSALFELV